MLTLVAVMDKVVGKTNVALRSLGVQAKASVKFKTHEACSTLNLEVSFGHLLGHKETYGKCNTQGPNQTLDESFSSHNHVRKFRRALPTKWRPKVTAIEESKDLFTLPIDELIGNLKVYDVVLEKDSKISKGKKEKYKLLTLKARKALSDKEVSCSESDDEEYAMAVRDLKKFFRKRGQFVRQPHDDKKNFRKIKEDKKKK
nr:UBN2 domain-containing protein [Tanacetum cinerariifolium]